MGGNTKVPAFIQRELPKWEGGAFYKEGVGHGTQKEDKILKAPATSGPGSQ